MLLLCPICAGEYETPFASCPSCGCGLVAGSLEEDRVEIREARYVELCRPRSYSLAMLIKDMLDKNEVAVLVLGGHSLSVLPHLAFGGELRVLVDARQLEYASELYQAYFESDDGVDFEPEE